LLFLTEFLPHTKYNIFSAVSPVAMGMKYFPPSRYSIPVY